MSTPSAIVSYRVQDTGVTHYFTGWTSIQIARALDARSNKITLTIKNPFLRFSNPVFQFKEDDIIEVFMSNDSSIDLTTDIPIMTGLVTEYSQPVGGGKALITMTAQDRTYALLNFRWTYSFVSKTAPEIIKSIVAEINFQYNENPDFSTIGTTSVDTLRPLPAGDAFPPKDLSMVSKTAYEWIEEVSQVDFLNAGGEASDPKVTMPYMFWIDKDNELHWTSRQDSVSVGSIYEADQDVFSIQFKKSVYDVINLVFFNAGKDKNGNGIMWYKYNDSTTLKGLRPRYIAMTDISRDYINGLIKADDASNQLNGSVSAAVTTIVVNSTAAFPATGTIRIDDEFVEYTGKNATDFTGCKRGSFGSGAGSHADNAVVEDSSTFGDMSNTDFRTYCKGEGQRRALAMTNKTAGLRWKGTMEMRGNQDYNPGDKVTLVLPSYGINQDLRIIDIRDTYNKSGWFTTIEFEEDVPEVATI